MVLEPADLFALARNPYALEFGVASESTWRHHPIQDPGEVQANGTVAYNTTESEEGKMYPHVFARFQKIYFDANFDFEHTQNVELWIDDNTHIIREEDAEDYKQMLRGSSVIKSLVALISKSPIITSLEILLEVEVMTNSNLVCTPSPQICPYLTEPSLGALLSWRPRLRAMSYASFPKYIVKVLG